MAVTYDATALQDGNYSGFAQGISGSVDGRTLYQATDVENTVSSGGL